MAKALQQYWSNFEMKLRRKLNEIFTDIHISI